MRGRLACGQSRDVKIRGNNLVFGRTLPIKFDPHPLEKYLDKIWVKTNRNQLVLIFL